MGADLIGRFLYLPEKLTDSEKKILQDHLNQIKDLIDEKKVEHLLDGEHDQEVDEILNKLYNLGTETNDYHCDTPEGFIERMQLALSDGEEFIKKGIMFDRATAVNYLEITGARQTQRDLNIKRSVKVIFSGEMSWGDDPDGPTYNMIGSLELLGITNWLYKFCFG